jgi:hypothetical protein
VRNLINLIDGTSVSYFLAYKCLMERNEDVSNFYKDNISIYLFPAVSLAAFSCELALKSKIFNECGKKTKVHDLHKLFTLLNSITQEDIMNRTINSYNMKSKVLQSIDTINFERFTDLLYRHKDSFVSWRYFHEGIPESDIDFLEALMFCLNGFDEDYKDYVDINYNQRIRRITPNIPIQ